MEENTYKLVYKYIQDNKDAVSPHELSRVTGKSRVSVHTALKRLLSNGDIEKIGLSPRVTYAIKGYTPILLPDLTIEEISRRIEPILKKYPIVYAGIFGAAVAEDGDLKGDIDIMISPNGVIPLQRLTALEHSLSDTLGIQVHLATDQGANKYIKSSMLKGIKIIYGSMR